jgi:hypothetical protein
LRLFFLCLIKFLEREMNEIWSTALLINIISKCHLYTRRNFQVKQPPEEAAATRYLKNASVKDAPAIYGLYIKSRYFLSMSLTRPRMGIVDAIP